MPDECKETADVILFFDELFDSLNGSYQNSNKRRGKILLKALTPTSLHNQIWTTAKQILKSMKFISKEGNVCVVPSVSNWLRTIENMECLRNKLFFEYNFKSLWCRHLNQDPLENFFGSLRSHGYRNNSLTCASFEAAFASLLINNLSSSYSAGSNCEEDSCEVFDSLSTLFFTANKTTNNSNEVDYEHIFNDDFIVDLEIKKKDPRIIAALQYVTGYILKQCHKNIFKNCENCKNSLYDANKATEYIRVREYNKNRAYLTYPSEELVQAFSNIQDIVHNIIKTKSSMYNIFNYIKVILMARLDLRFLTCDIHAVNLREQILNSSCMIFLYNWCRDINKIIAGKKIDYDSQDILQKLASQYSNKRRK